jgi:hypothetical protein
LSRKDGPASRAAASAPNHAHNYAVDCTNGDPMMMMIWKRNPSHYWKRVGSITTVSFLLATAGLAQIKTAPEPPSYPGQTQPARSEDAWEVQQRKAMEKKSNLERQQDIQKDTEKLLELATELKQAVDKSSENTLSLDVIKKAELIEKLAKQVKDKMKGP